MSLHQEKSVKRRNRSGTSGVTAFLVGIVIFFTFAILILPAIALSTKSTTMDCPVAVHEHTKECYSTDENGQEVLVCGMADYIVHTHDENCYDGEGNLICTLPEIREHIHDESCYEEQQVLVCDLEENDDHTHTEECYETEKILICGENELHTHDDSCYDENGQLICGMLELYAHQHDESCLDIKEESEPEEPVEETELSPADSDSADQTEAETEQKEENADQPDVEDQSAEKELLVFEESTDNVTVHVEADPEAFPEGTTMQVTDVDDEETTRTISDAVEGRVKGIRAVDITFADAEGKEIEPSGSIRVSMTAKLKKEEKKADLKVVHVNDKGEASELGDVEVETAKKETTASFEADRFSVYAVVYTVDFHWEVNGRTYEFSIPGGGFVSFTDLVEVLGIAGDTNREENKKDSDRQDTEPLSFDDVEISETTREFVADVESVEFSSSELVSVSKVEEKTTVGAIKDDLGLECEYSADLTKDQIEEINAGEVEAGDWALISLKAFDTEESLTVIMKNGDRFVIRVTDARDPLGLDGRTYAIVNQRSGTADSGNGNRYALSTTVSNGQSYNWRGNYFYSNEVTDTYYMDPVTGTEYCGEEAIAWTFEYNAEKDAYYVSADGKYLYIDPALTDKQNSSPDSLSLVTDKNRDDNGTLIRITTDGEGNYRFSGYNEDSLTLWDYGKQRTTGNSTTARGMFWLDNNNNDYANGNMRLCLPEDPEGSHKASLVWAKDLSNNQSVVIYQKVWNGDTDSYDFYAIDGNGNLQAVWESSDSLYWKGSPSIEWKMTELTNDDGTPSGYLRFYNPVTDTYLAPKSAGDGYAITHAADDLTEATMKTISVSLPGRDAGEYDSLIATWDYDDNTTYGIKLNYDPTNTSQPCSLDVKELLQSTEFMFAVRDPVVQKQLTTVETVDSVSKGIKISMYNFDGTEGGGTWVDSDGVEWTTSRDRLQFMCNIMDDGRWQSGYYTPGIVDRVLGDDGFPRVSSNGESVGRIFNAINPTDNFTRTDYVENANHLFLQSVYDTTGYYYYSGFDNFARLSGNDFIVYEQLGTPKDREMNNDGTPKVPDEFFYYRGNFLPFNDLDTTKQVLNYYDGGVQRVELDDDNPRKNEDLYLVKDDNGGNNPDYYFGMVMESKFQQGPNGLSDQGDPMVFEFTGDDDMWVFVDNVLLLDIGGIHDAFHGTINFQTGKIHVDGQNSGDENTYIKEQYWQAHQFPDGTEWTDRNDAKQHQFFTNGGEEGGKLKGTFLDYSTHDLKMFYMERGAGASNLQIRFNLPVLIGDEFRVTKNMLTTVSGQPIQSAYENAKFYYKAYIKQGDNWEEYSKTQMETLTGRTAVYDQDGYPEVEWKDNYIFEVKPGQTAIIPVTDNQVEYKVVEVEPQQDSRMLELFNVSNSDEDPHDSKSTTGKTVQRRGQVFFDNKPIDDMVNELRITKHLHGDLYTDSGTGSGYVEDQNGSPYFEFRIYLEATGGQLVPYSLGEYYQIDGETGKYVYYDKGVRKYAEPVNVGGATWYSYTYQDSTKDELLPEPKITEHTSQNGSLGDVRHGDTIIVKGLMEGTDFVVDERIDRTHMRQYVEAEGDTEAHWEEEWNNKYFFSNTDVTGAYIREQGGNPPLNIPDNISIAGDLFDPPGNAADLPVTVNAARGTIITDRDAEVTVHNRVNTQFELPVEKNWSDDFDMAELDENAAVSFTLKRYRLSDRTGTFTLNANVSGKPSNYDPTYIFTNTETNKTFVVRYSDMTESGTGRSKSFNLPVGSYTVTLGDDPEGYSAQHTQSGSEITVSSDNEQSSGGKASPEQITINAIYTRQSGNIQVTKNLAGYHGENSFENFTAIYTVTDLAGRAVTSIYGQPIAPVTLTYSDFNGSNSKTFTFANLPSGQYIVRETIGSTSFNNEKYTVVSAPSPESGIITVASGPDAQTEFTSTYTQVMSNPVRIHLYETAYGRNDTLYDNSSSFRPGDQVAITFMYQYNNDNIRYRVNGGTWITPPSGTSGRLQEVIRMTVPMNGITVEIQDGWSQIKADDVNVIKESTVLLSNRSMMPALSFSAPRMNAPVMLAVAGDRGTADITAENSAAMPDAVSPNQHFEPDEWSLTITMKNDGKLYQGNTEIGTFTKNDGKWSVTLNSADFDDLTDMDEDDNLYYYYIDSIEETDVPEGTTPSIDTDTDGDKEIKRLYSKNDADHETGRVLSATNNIILADKEITIVKVIKGTATPLAGAKFILTKVDADGYPISGADGYTSEELTVDGRTGTIRFTGLTIGRYKLEETSIPDGYIAKEGPYYFTIGKDSTQLDTTVPHELITPVSGSEYRIENEPGASLPHTGGPGSTLVYLLGIMFTCLAGTGLLMKKTREIKLR